ncbi:unnamed protein product [Orchesella dallaii]|uniref:Aminotransferase class I/classII large domain-containing protein n=1 Tax=Orchesella dallaii TaxID=48710 RepID=A0ABP1RM16_9HEXA
MIVSKFTKNVNPFRRYSSKALASFKDQLSGDLRGIQDAGTWKTERVITTPQSSSVSIQGTKGTLLNFCANNYLGLSSHPEVVQAGIKALERYGAGLSSVRFICGTQDIHKQLEEKIAKFHGREDAILYPSCFDANAGLFEQILGEEDAVFSDELNHASIIDGLRLCKGVKKIRYRHKNMEDLEEKLETEGKGKRRKLIVSDGVFSMDGNVAPLKDIVRLAEKYDALVFLDECHATGLFGKTGRGTEEFWGTKPVDIINSTLGKALGGAAGGYTTGPKELISLLRQRARPYLFSNSLPPPVVACASKALDLLLASSELTQKVADGTTQFRKGMTDAGFTILGEDHPICPVYIGDARLASEFADRLLGEGIYVIGFSYPVVPQGKARIRVQISASHDAVQIDKLIGAFKKIGKELNLI